MKHLTLITALVATLAFMPLSHAAPIRGGASGFLVAEGLTIHGHAEITVKPDIAYATLGVVTQSRDQSEATSDNASRVKAVISALEGSAIAAKDIQTQYYTIQPQYDYQATPPLLTGYQVTNSIRVTVRDLGKAGLILDKATSAGATEVSGISFDLADRSRAEGSALVAAVADARSKADLMAGAAGVSLVRITSISNDVATPISPIYMGGVRAMAGAKEPATTPIVPQEIQVSSDVTMTYSISTKE